MDLRAQEEAACLSGKAVMPFGSGNLKRHNEQAGWQLSAASVRCAGAALSARPHQSTPP